MVFLVLELRFLMMLEVEKCLILLGFIELITELENRGLGMKTSDMPFPVAGKLL